MQKTQLVARRAAALTAGIGLAASALVAGGTAAHADDVADLTGVVTNAAGVGLANTYVEAYTTPSDGSDPLYVDDVDTDATGRYTFTDLDPASLAELSDNPAVRSETEFKLFFSPGVSSAADNHSTGSLSRGLGGSRSLAKAASVVVPAGGTATAPTQALPTAAGLLVRVIGPNGAPIGQQFDAAGDYLGGTAFAQVIEADAPDLFKADGFYAQDSSDNGFYTGATPPQPVPADGLIYVRGLEPSVAYAVSGGGNSYNAATGATTSYVSRFFGGNGTYEDATPVTPAAGAFTPVDIKVSNALSPLEKPRIIGNSSFGSTLKADRGTWGGDSRTDFTYQWTRGGVAVPGATGTTYEVTKADKKKKIGLVVTAARSTFVGVAAADPTSKVGQKSKVKAKRDGDAFDVTVTVAKKKLARKLGTPKGKVVLLTTEGEVASKKAKLKNGQVQDLAPKRTFAAEKTFVVQYLGAGKLGSDTATAKLGGKGGKKKK